MHQDNESKIYRDAFTLILSDYVAAIPLILRELGGVSLIKLMIVSFIVRRVRLESIMVYSGHNKKDILPKALIQIGVSIDDIITEIPMISAAIDLLIRQELVQLHDEVLIAKGKDVDTLEISVFLRTLLRECSALSDEFILEEVLRSV